MSAAFEPPLNEVITEAAAFVATVNSKDSAAVSTDAVTPSVAKDLSLLYVNVAGVNAPSVKDAAVPTDLTALNLALLKTTETVPAGV